MLHLTEQAATLIAELVDRSELPPGAGLRIAQREDHPALAMSLREEPQEDDVLVLERDVAVFLAPIAARRTRTKVLDASRTETTTAFYLRD